MKKLLTLASILLLSGCVTYYYPETALEDGVYYAEDDPSYVIDSSGYVGVSYYPWSSLDYFYLGYYPYSRHGYGYYDNFSFGISYGYSPWYYRPTYYGYYSPWYAWHAPYYHYSHYYAWRPYNGHHYNYYGHGNRHYGNKYKRGKGHNKGYRNDSDYRYAGNGNGNNGRGNRRGEYADDVKSPAGRNKSRSYSSNKKAAPVKRYVSTTPSGHSGNRGMEVRSRGSKNTGKVRKQPIDHGSVTGIKLEPSTRRTTQTNYRSKRSTGSAGEVRYRAGAKQGRTRIQPIESASNSNRFAIVSQPARPVTASGNSGRYGHSVPVSSSGNAGARAASGHVSSRSTSPSRSASKSHRSSGSQKHSRSSSSSAGSRQSRQANSSPNKNRR